MVWFGLVLFILILRLGFWVFVVYSSRVTVVCGCCWLISVGRVVCGLLVMCVCIWVPGLGLLILMLGFVLLV